MTATPTLERPREQASRPRVLGSRRSFLHFQMCADACHQTAPTMPGVSRHGWPHPEAFYHRSLLRPCSHQIVPRRAPPDCDHPRQPRTAGCGREHLARPRWHWHGGGPAPPARGSPWRPDARGFSRPCLSDVWAAVPRRPWWSFRGRHQPTSARASLCRDPWHPQLHALRYLWEDLEAATQECGTAWHRLAKLRHGFAQQETRDSWSLLSLDPHS
mmetsp:Transcript_5256/g.14920  ORF Transcript_5256/g.14920 Transcript_5256/m.14920 type:complete len:215 (-) Transcript_5256:302-946(-)